jgi:hypothetical protein
VIAHKQRLLGLGAGCLSVGSVCVLLFRVNHGDLPTDTGAAALSYVAAHPLYPLVHLGAWLGVVLWAGGLVALSGTFAHPLAWAVGRLAAASVLLGAAVHVTEFSADGYALPTLAAAWAVAPPTERATLEMGARLALVVLGGPSTSALVILWGSTLVLYGLAVHWEGYPAWFGRVGVAVGAAIAVLGTVQFLWPNVVFPGVVLYGGGTIVTQPWTFALGVAMWRRARTRETGGDA